jgi:hypothetical protein
MPNRIDGAGPRRPRPLVLYSSLFLFLLPLLLTACSSFDPTEPGDGPQPLDEPTSRDQLVDYFFLAQAERDSALLVRSFGDGFVFELDPAWVAGSGLETSTLILGDMIAAAGNLCGGRAVMDDGQPRAPVTGIFVDSYEPMDDWTLVGKQDYGEVHQRLYQTSMRITLAGADDIVFAGEVLFRAAEYTETEGPGAPRTLYDLVGIVDGTFPPSGGVNDDCLSRLWRRYVGNEAPQAVLTPESASLGVGEAVLFRATGTTDPEGNFPALPYRWRLSHDDDWSAWTDEPDTVAVYTEEGRYTVSLQVRDRWGQTDTEFATVTVGKMYRPYTDPDAVYLNYVDMVENMDIEEYAHAIADDFVFVETDRDLCDHDTEIAIMDNIFGGETGRDQDGNPEAPVSHIIFMLTPIGIWQDILADDPYFGGITGLWCDFLLVASFERAGGVRLEVQGIVCMFLKKVAGPEGLEYRVLGFLDQTSPVAVSTEAASWTQVKELYR